MSTSTQVPAQDVNYPPPEKIFRIITNRLVNAHPNHSVNDVPARITDEFTHRTDLSRQQKYQLRAMRDGLCRLCGRPVEILGRQMCPEHHKEHLDRPRAVRVNRATEYL
jgi:hypothetical protein